MKGRSEPTRKVKTKSGRSQLEQPHVDELRVMPGYQTNEQLGQVLRKLSTDYEPYGEINRSHIGDCSGGCRWYHILAGKRGEDWGVCANPASPRSGLLTFEHQGCPEFQRDVRWDFLVTNVGQKASQKFEDREEELRQWRKAHPIKMVRAIPRLVGIFWLAGSRLVHHTSSLSEAEEYGDRLTHGTSHIEHWAHLQQTGVVPLHTEYEFFPRGRAVFDTNTERFTIYADRCILKRQAVTKRIMKIMNLPVDETDLKTDDQYQCSRCQR